MPYSVKLSELVAEHSLVSVYEPPNYEDVWITTPEINRPGLQLTGFYQHFDERRVQIIGRAETAYLDCLHGEDRRRCYEALMMRKIPALVICHDMDPHQQCEDMAQKYGIPLFRTNVATTAFISNFIDSLNMHLARRETRHGVLVEIHGEGVLMLGDSGIGKSETALELIKRGHRLIADDAVEIKRKSWTTLIGTALPLTRYYMELRGLGLINVRHIYGVGAVKPNVEIDLVVTLEHWVQEQPIDRLGIEAEHINILGVNLPHLLIPVRPGRNLAVILELAAMNNRQKKMGYNGALDLVERYDSYIDTNSANDGDESPIDDEDMNLEDDE